MLNIFNRIKSAVASLIICGASLFYYCILVYASEPISLHDTTHYAIAGVNMLRDGKNLIYPYGSLKAFTYGASYESFQGGTHVFDSRMSYPNKLFSLLYGVLVKSLGEIKLGYLHILSCLSLCIGNCFVFFASSRWLNRSESILALFLINMMPLMAIVFPHASTDAMSYMFFAFLLWMSQRVQSVFVLGVILGFSILIRAQSIFLVFCIPLLNNLGREWRAYIRSSLFLSVIALGVVFLTGKIIGLFVESSGTGGSLVFYWSYFKESIYGLNDIHRIIFDLLKDLSRLFDGNAFYLFMIAPLLWFFKWDKNREIEFRLSLSVIVLALIPLIIYAFDRFFPVVNRYYINAIPFAVFVSILSLRRVGAWGILNSKTIKIILASVCFGNLISYVNTQDIEGFSIKRLMGVVSFLDADGFQKELEKNFGSKSIILTNHSYISGFINTPNIVYVPEYSAFQRGRNGAIDGIVFVYTTKPEAFIPDGWLDAKGAVKPELTDNSGAKFTLVYRHENVTWSGYQSHFVIYKKMN